MGSGTKAAARGARRGWLGAIGLALLLASGSGCVVVGRGNHAYDDYRRIEDEDFRYQRDYDFYVGVNLPSVYWCDGDFYREHGDGYWEWSRHPRGPWYYVANEHVPSRLWKAYRKPPGNKHRKDRDRD
jgi:hypothetical protein